VVNTSIVVVLGLGFAVGILGLLWSILAERASDNVTVGGRKSEDRVDRRDRESSQRARKILVPAAAGLLCVLVTRWPVAGILGALACATLPNSLRRVAPGGASKRTEAVASWTELLRDSLAASAGLSQAIVMTASSAPMLIRPQVSALATRLSNGMSLETALRIFAREVDEPAAEFLVCALLLAATSRAQRLVEVLSALVDAVRADVAMHLRVDASRASARSSVRTVVVFSMVFACVLTVIAHSYLSPFGTTVGQFVLAIVGLLYAVGLTLMVRLVRPVPEMRLLDTDRVR